MKTSVKPRLLVIAATLSAALCAPAALAQSTAASSQQGTAASAALSSSDRSFVNEAAKGGLFEVELGKVAQDKAAKGEVKSFAERMVKDHSAANDELQQVAQSLDVKLPQSLDAKQRKTIDRLNKLHGGEFDRAYMKEMVKDHKHDVAAFKKEASSGKNAQIKGFASKTLPTLQEHLKMAENAQQEAKNTP